MQFDLFYEFSLPPGGRESEAEALADWLAELELADALGFRAAWLVEHHFTPGYSHSSASDLLLAAAAARTHRLRFGLGVVPLPLHHPVRVAERVATLDLISGGRLEVGVGRGFSPQEYAVFGADMGESVAAMDRALAVLRAHFAGEPVSYAGQRLTLRPQMLQKPPPLWVAAVSPERFAWVAEQGAGLLVGPFKPWFMTRADIETYTRVWAARQPGAPRVGLAVGVFCLEDGARARALAAPAFAWFYRSLLETVEPVLARLYPGYAAMRQLGRFRRLLRLGVDLRFLRAFGMAVVGSPEECIAAFRRYQQAGVTHVLAAVGAGALPTALVRESLHCLAEEVLPAFSPCA